MRVAIVAPLVTAIREPQRGGSQSIVADLALGLQARGHEVHVYAAAGSEIPGVAVIQTGIDPEALSDFLYRAGAPSRFDGSAAEEAFSKVYEAVKRGSYDIVHNHAFDAPAIRLATVEAPVVHTLHLPPDPSLVAALEEVRLSERPPVVATVSASQANAWATMTRVDAVLPNGVPTVRISWTERPGVGVLFAGRLSPEKGAAEAIDIAKAAGERIDLYGDPYDLEYAEKYVFPHRDEPGVHVHSAVERTVLWEMMAKASVVLCPAQWDEPFGMVAAEAQAAGTPVVAFRRGGLAEIVRDGITGFLVTPGDVGAAAEAVKNAARGISRSACRHHAEKCLDFESSLNEHERLYRRVTSQMKARSEA